MDFPVRIPIASISAYLIPVLRTVAAASGLGLKIASASGRPAPNTGV